MLVNATVVQAHSLTSDLGPLNVSQAQVLGAWVPAVLTLVTILHDGLSLITWPKRILTGIATLSAPFKNFLTIDDLKNVGPKRTPPVWKLRALTAIAFVNSAGWLALLAYVLIIDDFELSIEALIAAVTWVCEFTHFTASY